MRRLWMILLCFVVALPVVANPAAAQDDAAVLETLMDQAQQRPRLAGPLRGYLPLGLAATHTVFAGVDVRDFYAHATFSDPTPETDDAWDAGISFRHAGGDAALKLIIDSDGTWYLRDGMQPMIASGEIANLATGAGETNHIDLVAIGDAGYFAINDAYVATLDLSARDNTGDVGVGAAYFAEHQRADEAMLYEEFELWSLERTASATATDLGAAALERLIADATATAGEAGPFSGALPLAADTVGFSTANVSMRDFYAHASFTNPYLASTFPWDIGFGFRDHGGQDIRLAVRSDGQWFLSLSADPFPFLVAGQGARLNTGAGEQNALDLAVKGDSGYLAVNGAYVAAIDLTASGGSGDVWVGSGFFEEDTLVGSTTPFADFRVWSLDPSEPAAEPVDIVVRDDDELIFNVAEVDQSGVSGLVSLVANGEQTTVEVGVFGAVESDDLGIFSGTCDELAPTPEFALAPVSDEVMASVTILDVGIETLTDGQHAIAIHASADEGGAIRACNEVPLVP